MLIMCVTTDDENDSMEDVILVMDLWWIWSILATYMLTHYSTTSLTCSNVPMIHFHHHHIRFYGAISNHLISIGSPNQSYLKNAVSIDSHDFNFSIISKYQCNIEWFIHLQFMIRLPSIFRSISIHILGKYIWSSVSRSVSYSISIYPVRYLLQTYCTITVWY